MPNLPISIAIATFNGAKYLEEQLDSILSQTLSAAEIVVTDDHSTDGTIDILERYQKEGLLRYYVNESRLGYIANFKRAVSLCAPGHYIALSDQDDVWLPGKLEAAMNTMRALDQNNPAMVYSDLVLVDPELNVLNPSFRNELGQDTYQHSLETLLFGGFVNGCTMLMNPLMRNYFDTIPTNSSVPHDSWITMIGYTFGQAAMVPETQILYRKHSHNATDVRNHTKRSRYQRLKLEVLHAFQNNDLFENEIARAGLFYEEFGHLLSQEQDALFKRFLRLKGRSYLVKKMTLRRFFRGKWVSGGLRTGV